MTTVNYYDLAGESRAYTSNQLTWAAAYSAADADGVAANLIPAGSKVGAGNYSIGRAFLPFDTSLLPAGVSIQSAVLHLYRDDSITAFSNADTTALHVVSSTEANPASLAVGDYDATGAVSGGSINLASTSNTTYFTITLNATALSWVTKAGNTLLALRISTDLTNTEATGNNVIAMQARADANPPYLEITYTQGGNNVTGFFEM
jgi:hypothetical protein